MPHPYGFDSSPLSLPLEVVARHGAEVDRRGRFPEESIAALGAAGLLGLTVSAELGGLGQGPRAFCVVAEELASACASTAMVYVMHTAAVQAIASSKPLAEPRRDPAGGGEGKHLTTLALSEKGSRSQFWAPVSKLAGEGRRLRHQRGQVLGHLRRTTPTPTSSSAQAPGAQSPLESTLYLARAGAAGVRPAERVRRPRAARQRLVAGEPRERCRCRGRT